jgi:hypothetical protein
LPGLDEEPGLIERITSLHESGLSLNSIAANLNSDGHRTPNGRRWHSATVARIIYRPRR